MTAISRCHLYCYVLCRVCSNKRVPRRFHTIVVHEVVVAAPPLQVVPLRHGSFITIATAEAQLVFVADGEHAAPPANPTTDIWVNKIKNTNICKLFFIVEGFLVDKGLRLNGLVRQYFYFCILINDIIGDILIISVIFYFSQKFR